jgi:hypothetical protein
MEKRLWYGITWPSMVFTFILGFWTAYTLFGWDFPAWLRLTPVQRSSGGKERLGRISKMGDQYLSLEIAPNTEINIQKAAVQMLLPKGTLKSLQ